MIAGREPDGKSLQHWLGLGAIGECHIVELDVRIRVRGRPG
jgi:hypothetical protein